MLGYGSAGWGVKCVQAGINEWHRGHNMSQLDIAVDGIFGAATLREVKHFQQYYSYDVDGIVGPDTGNGLYWTFLDHLQLGCYNSIPTTE
ncbi:peptidoglycan-binding protein [Streptomyces sp. LMG1-1-1.1]